jgi:hypothetical protein
MTIRVDREGFGQTIDPGAVGQRSSGAQVYDDGKRPEPWAPGPWAGRSELAVSDTLRLMSIPSEEIAAIRPPVPYVLFPEQELGFVNQPLTIDQILDTDRWSPQQRSWLSPTIRPNTRAEFQANAWSGTARGVSMSVNPML